MLNKIKEIALGMKRSERKDDKAQRTYTVQEKKELRKFVSQGKSI